MSRSWPVYLAIVAVAVIALGVAAVRFENTLLHADGPARQAATVVIARGSNIEAIGRQLESSDMVARWWLFALAVYGVDRGAPLKAGEYAFAARQPLHDIIEQLREGRTVVHRLTVPEGLTVAEIASLIESEPALAGDIGTLPAEGSLMPDTYNFSLADSRADMIGRMRRAMDKALREAWDARAPGGPLSTPGMALALASIVEKETAAPEERPKVAGVFLNRLGRGMRLQSDPTVIYALTQGGRTPLGRALVHADLAVDSPFNSYQHEGLPPAPIACPGRGALHAALHPDIGSALYFVADGTGHHVFADTLDEHNRNVTHLRRLEGRLPSGASVN